MLLIFALFIAAAVALAVFAVEYADRMNQKKLNAEAEYWPENWRS